MTICYSSLFSLMIILSITHWTHSASLGTSLLNRRSQLLSIPTEESTAEPILSRRRPLLPMSDRRRRGAAAADDEDEVEVQFPQNEMSTPSLIVTSTMHQAVDEESTQINETNETVTNPMVTDGDVTIINQTEPSIITTEVVTVEMKTEVMPNITTMDQTEENSTAPTTESVIIQTTVENSVEPMALNRTVESISTDAPDNQKLVTEIPLVTTETVRTEETVPNNITIALEEFSTVVSVAAEDISTSAVTAALISTELPSTTLMEVSVNDTSTAPETSVETTIFSTENATMIADVDTTMVLETNTTTDLSSENVTLIEEPTTSIDVSTIYSATNMTDLIMDNGTDTNETDNVEIITTVTPPDQPAVHCDRSCQCANKCPYGFEMVNDQCKCDPPCKNYQCFGNDTCVMTKEGQPFCEPSSNDTTRDRPQRCYQPRDEGYHGDDIKYYNRWYYHPEEDQCHLLVYRGLGGNENNFLTLNECHLECITCAPAPDRGTCFGSMNMWYYDHKSRRCSKFEYSGCKGNDNRFWSEKDCVDACVTRILNL